MSRRIVSAVAAIALVALIASSASAQTGIGLRYGSFQPKGDYITMDATSAFGAHVALGFIPILKFQLGAEYLSGTAASGLHEARLGREEFGGETHVFAAAYREDEFEDIASVSDHIVFNSFTQLEKFRDRALKKGKKIGVRVKMM